MISKKDIELIIDELGHDSEMEHTIAVDQMLKIL